MPFSKSQQLELNILFSNIVNAPIDIIQIHFELQSQLFFRLFIKNAEKKQTQQIPINNLVVNAKL